MVIHVSIYAHIIRHNLWDTSLMHHRYLIEIHTNTFKYMYPPDTVGGCIRPIFGGKRNHPLVPFLFGEANPNPRPLH